MPPLLLFLLLASPQRPPLPSRKWPPYRALVDAALLSATASCGKIAEANLPQLAVADYAVLI
jgi:hypothetical protein